MRAAAALLLAGACAWCQDADRIRIPAHPAKPLFVGEQGPQKTWIHFDPASGMVTLEVLVQDAQGDFISGIPAEAFAVYENGVRQKIASAHPEDARVSLESLLEYGAPAPALRQDLARLDSRYGQQLVSVLGREDRMAIETFGSRLTPLADFTSDGVKLDSILARLTPPHARQVRLYDALVAALRTMRRVEGRKAVVLVSSGVDSGSGLSFDDAVRSARESDAPVYAIAIGPTLRDSVALRANPLDRVDWAAVETRLGAIARASGGRLYSRGVRLDLTNVYRDLLSNLKERYVITYRSTTQTGPDVPRQVEVKLVAPATGEPLRIVAADGAPVQARVILRKSYAPAAAK